MNEALRAKFLDLKEGAIVVSLKPFVSPNARVTERNVSGPYSDRLHDPMIPCPPHRSTTYAPFSMWSSGHTGLGVSHGEVAAGHTICTASIGWATRM